MSDDIPISFPESPQREMINCRCVLVVPVDEERAEEQVQVLLDEILMALGVQPGTEVTKQ